MKKRYFAPDMIEVRYEMNVILNNGSIIQNGDNATVTPDEEEYNGSDWNSRRHDMWEDEEEDNAKR